MKNFIRVLDWDMSWCFHCDAACAHCPYCKGNSCACGCTNLDEDNNCQGEQWWESLRTKEFKLTREMYWQPTQEELVEYINRLEVLEGLHKSMIPISNISKLLKYCSHKGLKIEFKLVGDNWSIKLLEIPDTPERRPHLLTKERAQEILDWNLKRAQENLMDGD